MTPHRRFKAIDDYPSKFDWPGIKGLNMQSRPLRLCGASSASNEVGARSAIESF